MVERSVQRAGSSGAVAPPRTSSTGEASSRPIRLEERLLPRGAEHHADVRGADVRGLHQHVLDGQPRAVVVEVADGEAARSASATSMSTRVCGETRPASSAVGDGEGLEDRAELVAPLRGAVEERAVGRVALGRQRRAEVGVEVGQARERPDLAGVGLHQDADRALGAHLRHALGQHVLERGLHLEVDREPQRLVDARRVAQPRVEDPLDAGGADDLGRVARPRGRSSAPPRTCAASAPFG